MASGLIRRWAVACAAVARLAASLSTVRGTDAAAITDMAAMATKTAPAIRRLSWVNG